MTSHEAVPVSPSPAAGPAIPPPDWLPDWLGWFWNLGEFVVESVLRTVERSFTVENLQDTFVFIVLIVGFYFFGKFVRGLLRRSVLAPHRMDPAIARLTGHGVVFFFLAVGFSVALSVFGTSITALATGLGLLSLALGFGMQNTVANIMGGMSLAFDKPFRIGDRIRVGDYWGTVQIIGLRSTRIETPRKDVVIIPNKIMEEREIWNYTLSSPEYRLDIDIGISYDSDWRLAEKIMLDVADAHPNILHYPPSRMVMREFADFAVGVQLRAWIADVTVRADTISDLLKSVKDRFDAEGVEIPYPYRTNVDKKDLPVPRRLAQDTQPFARNIEGMKEKILVAVAGPQPVRERAAFVASLAKALSAGVVALYIQRPGTDQRVGEDALRILGEIVRSQRIWYKPVARTGDIVNTIRDVAREENADLILVGAGRGGVSSLWRRAPEVGSRLRQELSRPVFTVPKDLKLTLQLVAWLKEQMRAGREMRQGGSTIVPALDDAGATPPASDEAVDEQAPDSDDGFDEEPETT